MVEIAKRLKINKRFASLPCRICGDGLELGEAGALCEACESPHHERCWDKFDGCGKDGCPNAFPPHIEVRGVAITLKPDQKLCPYCLEKIYLHADICRYCLKIVSGDGEYHGEKTMPADAKLSIVFGVFGSLLACTAPPASMLALVLGPLAFNDGASAKKLIAADLTKRGSRVSAVGQVAGVIDVLIWCALVAVKNLKSLPLVLLSDHRSPVFFGFPFIDRLDLFRIPLVMLALQIIMLRAVLRSGRVGKGIVTTGSGGRVLNGGGWYVSTDELIRVSREDAFHPSVDKALEHQKALRRCWRGSEGRRVAREF